MYLLDPVFGFPGFGQKLSIGLLSRAKKERKKEALLISC